MLLFMKRLPPMTKFCNPLKNKEPTFSSFSFVCSSNIPTRNDDRMRLPIFSKRGVPFPQKGRSFSSKGAFLFLKRGIPFFPSVSEITPGRRDKKTVYSVV
jgi:hypothetical protein